MNTAQSLISTGFPAVNDFLIPWSPGISWAGQKMKKVQIPFALRSQMTFRLLRDSSPYALIIVPTCRVSI